jgi:hypothetical protein
MQLLFRIATGWRQWIPLNPGTFLPFGLIRGSADQMWFFESLETGDYALARVTAQGHITDFPIPGAPVRMTTDLGATFGTPAPMWVR